MKLFLGALVIAAIISLFSGLVFLIKDAGEGDRLIKALWYRLGFSIAVLVLIVVLVYTGHLTLNAQP
ncbi:MAG: hypothetical protein CME36_13945 [unclassified Hahellaceae]|nr:hypothetical protein [Hahellaceae bacterium]|tara:strand:+ start:22154 stop:22354 length:201 start_codon:yes stop_codon:yes gene_type:complete